MRLLREISNSIYSPEYYETIHHRPFSLSVRYFLTLIAVLSLVGTIFLSFFFVPQVYRFVTSIVDEALVAYPPGLELHLAEGQASSNVREPYFIDYPPRLRAALEVGEVSLSERFITIATREEASLEAALRYKTMIMVGQDGLVNATEPADQAVMPYGAKASTTLTQATLSNWHNTYRPYLLLLPPLLVLFIFIFFIFIFALNLFTILIGAPFIMLIGQVFQIPLSYGKAYQYGLHAITASIVVDMFLLIVPGGLPWLATLAIMLGVLLAVVYANFKGLRQIETHN